MDNILQINQITKLYSNRRGIRDITFEVGRGDIFGLFGPNGAGKTTLLKIVTGLIRANKGTVKLFGYNPAEQFEKAMERVGCIVEAADSYEYLSAMQNLQLIASFYPNVTVAKMEAILERVGLHKVRNEKVKQFSTGMKQRMALAAVLVAEPELIILDEPTNGLDIEGMADFRELIIGLAKEKRMTFIISSHMIHEMERMCNRIGIVYEGRLVQAGLLSELLSPGQTLEEYYLDRLRSAREDRAYA